MSSIFSVIVSLLLMTSLIVTSCTKSANAMSNVERLRLRDEVKEMFYHAYNGYMKYAFPKDELKPLTCQGHDTWGGYSLTLLDSLDTLLVMGDHEEFKKAVLWVTQNINFDYDFNVSVFETNIRVMGGLLSAHLLATDSSLIDFPEYDGKLLELATDLGNRLLPAFQTPTGIPYGTVNLKHGVPVNESELTCTSGATTFSLEFGLLSKLVGDSKYELAARNAVDAIWARKSPLGLVGNHINIITGAWTHIDAGIGRAIDSFYEYLLKAAIYFGDDHYYQLFLEAYNGTTSLKYGDFYLEVEMNSGSITWPIFNSLSAFWVSLQVMKGDLVDAIRSARAFHSVWKENDFTPESLNLLTGRALFDQEGYPLRPELAESLYYLSQAFPYDSEWLLYGKDLVDSLNTWTKTGCGYAAIRSIYDHTLSNRMDSFFLAETCKYLYLLFDQDNWVNQGNYIFNTEAHLFPFSYNYLHTSQPTESIGTSNLTCTSADLQTRTSWLNFNNPLYKHNQCTIYLVKKLQPIPPATKKPATDDTKEKERKQEIPKIHKVDKAPDANPVGNRPNEVKSEATASHAEQPIQEVVDKDSLKSLVRKLQQLPVQSFAQAAVLPTQDYTNFLQQLLDGQIAVVQGDPSIKYTEEFKKLLQQPENSEYEEFQQWKKIRSSSEYQEFLEWRQWKSEQSDFKQYKEWKQIHKEVP